MGTHCSGGDGGRPRELEVRVLAPVGTVGTGHDESVDRGSHQRPRHLHGYPWDIVSTKVTELTPRPAPLAAPPPTRTPRRHSRYAVAESRSLGLGVRSMVRAV